MKRVFIILFLFFFSAILYAQQIKGSRPNIIFILADDLGNNDLACYGNPVFETHNLDRLAASGLRFTQAYVCAPNCAPSRACLMTGKFTPRHSIYTVGTSERGKSENRKLVPVVNKTVLDTSFYTMAEMLRDAGYETINIGKWHLGEGIHGPEGQGFAINIGGNDLGSVTSHFNKYRSQIPGLSDVPDSVFLADALTNKAVDFINSSHDKPYFLYLPYYSVHTPVQAPQNLIAKYKKILPADSKYSPVYAAMVENLDDNVGKITEAAKHSAQPGNTIIVFLSDNGPLLNFTSVDLRGEKGSLYEGGIREPMIINWPGKIQDGGVIQDPVTSADFYPTFAALAGQNLNDSRKELDGESLIPLLEGKNMKDRPMIWHLPCYLEAARKNAGLWRETPSSAIRYGKWKLVVHYENDLKELFDLDNDSKEENDLSSKNKKIVDRLSATLNSYLQKTNAFIPKQINPGYKEKDKIK